MSINAGSIKSGNVVLQGPQGQKPTLSFLSFDSGSGNAVYQAALTLSYQMNGTWSWTTSANEPVLDNAGNPVQGGQLLGSFEVNIPTPADTTPPTAVLMTLSPAGPITASGAVSVNAVVTYSDIE